MLKIELPPPFVKNIEGMFGETGRAWLNNLPNHLKFLTEKWDVQIIRPVSDLSCGFVALVRCNVDHTLAILKTAPKNGNLLTEVNCLKSFKRGVPKIFKLAEAEHAYLMEYLEPGTPLKTLIGKGRDEEATRIVCATILDLQLNSEPVLQQQTACEPKMGEQAHNSNISNSSKPAAFKHITELTEALPLLKGQVEDIIIAKAQSLFHDLSVDRSNDIMLHGDLHHDNILQCGESWRAIDPHGYIGDKAAEVGTMIRNPYDCFPKDKPLKQVLETRLKILAEMLPFDAQRIRAWTFCFTILSAAWDIEESAKITENTAEVGLMLHTMVP